MIPISVVTAWLAVAERLAALWARLRRRGKGWPRVERPRPPTGPQDGCVSIWEVVGVTFLMGVLLTLIGGCAALGGGAPQPDDLAALCEEYAPCAPCPPVPVCPPAPECPEVVAPEGEEDDQPADFGWVWKPIADVGGMAAVIIPAHIDCSRLVVHYGGRSEEGRYIGKGNGQRMAFRLSRPGKAYGRKIRVVCVQPDGASREWRVPNGANRTEYRGR